MRRRAGEGRGGERGRGEGEGTRVQCGQIAELKQGRRRDSSARMQKGRGKW